MARKGLCRECWPNGWPADMFAAGCEHGSFERTNPNAKPVKAEFQPSEEEEAEPERSDESEGEAAEAAAEEE